MNARVKDDRFAAVPETIRDRDQWCVWRFDDANNNRVGPNDGGSKVPYQTNGRRAASNKPETWTTFANATAAYHRGGWEGIAFLITADDPYTGVDLDGCIDEGENLRGWVLPILLRFDGVAYGEVSPSGTGIKLITWAEKPEGSRCVSESFGEGRQHFECYDFGRFWTITGDVYNDFRRIEDGQEAVDWLCDTYLSKPAQPAAPMPELRPASCDLNRRAMGYVTSTPHEGEGGRNQGAFSLAGHLHSLDHHGQRLSQAEILNHVRAWNAGNNPPIDDSELQRAVRSSMVNGTPREIKPAREPERYPDVDLSGINRQLTANEAPPEDFDDFAAENDTEDETVKDPRLVAPQILTYAALQTAYPLLRQWLLDGLLRLGETANIIAATKVGKTWLILNLAFSVAFGLKWLGIFEARQGRVLVVDNELHAETLAFRLRTVADALGIRSEDIGDSVQVLSLRGRGVDINGLWQILEKYPPGYFSLIILDAKYRLEVRGSKENSNEDQTAFYNFVDAIAAKLNCSVALVHHASKGDQGEKAVTDVGAGGGGQSRATDCHLILRPHEEDGAVVLDAAVRSFKPVTAQCLRFSFPLWYPAEDLDPAALKRPQSRRRKESGEKPPKPQFWTPKAFADTFLTANPTTRDKIAADAVGANVEGMERISSSWKAEQLLRQAEAAGFAHRWKFGRHDAVQFASVPQPVLTENEESKAG